MDLHAFSCGMGIGLMFWSVAEPITHYASNPFTQGLSDESARMAMQLTFFIGDFTHGAYFAYQLLL